MSFWIKWGLLVLCGFGAAIGGIVLAQWLGSPMYGWCIGWSSAILMGSIDRAFVRRLKAKAQQ